MRVLELDRCVQLPIYQGYDMIYRSDASSQPALGNQQ